MSSIVWTHIGDNRYCLRRTTLGSALVAAGQLDAALAEDERILKADPRNAAAQVNAATAYYRKGDLNRTRYLFQLIHQAHPDDASAAIGLAYAYIKLQRNADAADLLNPLEAANSSNLNFEYVLGYALILSGKETDGVQRMEKVAQARHSADAWMISASALFQRRLFRQAQVDADQAIAINPAFPGAQTLAGQARFALGEIDKAITDLQSALRQNPRDFTANLYLGIIRSKQRDFASARCWNSLWNWFPITRSHVWNWPSSTA